MRPPKSTAIPVNSFKPQVSLPMASANNINGSDCKPKANINSNRSSPSCSTASASSSSSYFSSMDPSDKEVASISARSSLVNNHSMKSGKIRFKN